MYVCVCVYTNQHTYQVIGQGGMGRAYRVTAPDDTVRVMKCELDGTDNSQDSHP